MSRRGRERVGFNHHGWLWAVAIVAGLAFSVSLPSVVEAFAKPIAPY